MHVDSIVLDTVRSNPPQSMGRATVLVIDDLGDPVAGATVVGSFTGDLTETASGPTDGTGSVILDTAGSAKKPEFEFCIADITHTGLDYAPGDNVVTCASSP
jgi:hypothetical protein